MNDDNRGGEFDRPEADDDLGIPIVPESHYDTPESDSYEPESLDDSEETPELHSVNVPPLDEGFEDLPHEEYVDEYIEPLNPWISIVTRPRETIRYIIETGVWNNWIVIYSIAYAASIPPALIGIFASPESVEGFSELSRETNIPAIPLVVLGFLLAMMLFYPVALGCMWLMGWIYKVIGSWFGGVGTGTELRIALVWGGIVGTYVSYVGMVPNAVSALYYWTAPNPAPAFQIGITLLSMLVLLPLYIYSIVVHCKAVGEAHQFSAWLGFVIFIIFTVALMALIMIPIALVFFMFFVALSA